ncbi:conserved unknown protein [Ectocarpus siliculosus]|uniref:FAM13A-like domain-containing protein n=1 Tax=Ectocarpus siliculosus TaxID=2880 RepID=D7FSH7_ECTSI|nr:conserved unknown protein [Ectocarpus siliculosus]|eukprot:CBJ31118.1 conserved unknown protein [Ectocarpus siliculosus]
MESNDLPNLKTHRKRLKKDIQAWITAFEEREGRPPEAKDKEEIRPLYREYRELEAKIASISAASPGDGAATEGAGTTRVEPQVQPLPDGAGDAAGVGGDNMDVATIKIERDAKKRDIKQWIQDFEEREGHTPTTKEKAPIKNLYIDFKELERRLAACPSIGGGDEDAADNALRPEMAAGGDVPADVESVKAEKKKVKREIQTWLDEFEAREGRAALQEDKAEIRPLYKRHKELERKLDTTNGDLDPTAMLLSPTSSAGEIPVTVPPYDGDSRTDEDAKQDGGKQDGGNGSGQSGVEEEKGSSCAVTAEGGEVPLVGDGDKGIDAGKNEGTGYVDGKEDSLAQTPPEGGGADEASSPNMEAFGEITPPPIITDRSSSSGADTSTLLTSGGGEEREKGGGSGGDNGESNSKPTTAQEARVRRMRARFLNMKNLIEGDESALPSSPKGGEVHEEETGGTLTPSPKGAKNRWALLGDAVAPNRLSSRSPARPALAQATGNTDSDKERDKTATTVTTLQAQGNLADGVTSEQTSDAVFAPLADDGVSGAWVSGQLSDLLLSDAPPPPPPAPPGLESLEAEASRLRGAVDPPPPGYVAEYQSGVRGAELVVASVGVEEVRARERALELERLANAREETNIYRAREANLLYREDRARRRVLALKEEIESKVNIEKQAVIEISIAGERALAPAFTRARRGLERAIRAQAGRVREVFGELQPGETPGGRKFRVDWKGVPQPVEIRLHCIRAVRDRLPRGSYVMLSSMAERLGGRVMRWTKGADFDDFDEEDSIDTDGGDTRPAATLPVKHGGRYFDRELRLDQNVYQLCPSKSEVRPGNVMVFELFRLAGSGGGGGGGGGARCGSSRHKGGELDEDTAVGWCVLPLADSRLRIVRGSFRIPLLRGEPNPNIDLHEGLEKLIAADLEAWLGNLYLDIRHLPRVARLDGPGLEGGSAIGGEGYDIEYDHVRKVARLGRGLWGKLIPSAGRWERWKARKETGSEAGEAKSLLPLITELGENTSGGTAGGGGDTEDLVPKPVSNEAEGMGASTDHEEEKASTKGEEISPGDSKKIKKVPWFGTKKDKKKWIDDALPPPDTVKLKKAVEKQSNKRRGDGGIEAPPPQGGWASHLEGEEDVDDGNDNEEHVKIEETVDEECLSDDDMPRGSTFRFTPSGEAALAVDKAAGSGAHTGGHAKGVGLRRRGEGARWDSAALGLGHRGLPKRYSGGNNGARDSHMWTPLTNPAEMEFYRFAVASDPGTDAPATPAHIIAHKLRYIQQEVLLDLHPRGWRVVEYWLAVMVFVGALWLRVYIHALGQWFLLYALGVPVFSFTPRLWEFAIKYMDRSSSLGVEIAFVWWGPTFVMLCFAAVAALARLWGLAACGGKGGGGGEGVPEAFSRFVAAFGVAAGLDPYLLFIVDFMAGNHDCSSKCFDYTSPTCRCHEGDSWKLYVRLDAEEGAGISGALLTVMIYAFVSVTTALILHQYLLHAHMNGRMLDVWRRLNADEDNFFIPHDLELSAAELQHACVRARKWRGPNGARREVVFFDFHVSEEEDGQEAGGATPRSETGRGPAAVSRRGPGSATGRGPKSGGGKTTHVVIYDVSVDSKKSLHRQFLQTSDGTILEVFGEAGREVGMQFSSSLNALLREEIGGVGAGSNGAENDEGIFAGMLPTAAASAIPSASAHEESGESTSAMVIADAP